MCSGSDKIYHTLSRSVATGEIENKFTGLRLYIPLGRLTEGLHWVNTLMRYLVETYHSTSLPLLYIPVITSVSLDTLSLSEPYIFSLQLLSLMMDNSECAYLISLSQLLFKTYMNLPSGLPAREVHVCAFKAFFDKVVSFKSPSSPLIGTVVGLASQW